MALTPAPWTAELEPFEDGTPFHRIKAGDGHFHFGNGFNLLGVIAPDDAALLAAAPVLLALVQLAVTMRTAQQARQRLRGLDLPAGLIIVAPAERDGLEDEFDRTAAAALAQLVPA